MITKRKFMQVRGWKKIPQENDNNKKMCDNIYSLSRLKNETKTMIKKTMNNEINDRKWLRRKKEEEENFTKKLQEMDNRNWSV